MATRGLESDLLKVFELQLQRQTAVFWLVGLVAHEAFGQAVRRFDRDEPVLEVVTQRINRMVLRRP